MNSDGPASRPLGATVGTLRLRSSEKCWRRRPDLNRGWRFCRLSKKGYVVDSSCFLVSAKSSFYPVFGAVLDPNWTQVQSVWLNSKRAVSSRGGAVTQSQRPFGYPPVPPVPEPLPPAKKHAWELIPLAQADAR